MYVGRMEVIESDTTIWLSYNTRLKFLGAEKAPAGPTYCRCARNLEIKKITLSDRDMPDGLFLEANSLINVSTADRLFSFIWNVIAVRNERISRKYSKFNLALFRSRHCDLAPVTCYSAHIYLSSFITLGHSPNFLSHQVATPTNLDMNGLCIIMR